MKLSTLRKSIDRATKELQGVFTTDRTEQLWKPQDGPQTQAFNSPADETLFGGAAGFYTYYIRRHLIAQQ